LFERKTFLRGGKQFGIFPLKSAPFKVEKCPFSQKSALFKVKNRLFPAEKCPFLKVEKCNFFEVEKCPFLLWKKAFF